MNSAIDSAIDYMTENNSKTKQFVNYVRKNLKEELKDFNSVKLVNKTITTLYGKFNTLYSDEEYIARVSSLFNVCNGLPQPQQSNAAFILTVGIREKLIDMETDIIKQNYSTKESVNKTFCHSEGGLGKIRYIAGWCLATTKHRKKETVKRNLYSDNKLTELEKLKGEIKIIETLESSEYEVLNTEDKSNTQCEISRKQNVNKGLTSVTGECFNFFVSLDEKVRKLENLNNLNLYGTSFTEIQKHKVQNDEKLYNQFVACIQKSNVITSEELCKDVLNEITNKYLKMSVSQLRKEYLRETKTTKTEAHRKQIKIKATKNVPYQKLTMKKIKNDRSNGKIASHRQLQFEVEQNNMYLEQSDF